VDHHLADRLFVTGQRPAIAGLSMVGYLYSGAELSVPLGYLGNITRWKDRVKAR
jgi:glutathione S-transferase